MRSRKSVGRESLKVHCGSSTQSWTSTVVSNVLQGTKDASALQVGSGRMATALRQLTLRLHNRVLGHRTSSTYSPGEYNTVGVNVNQRMCPL